MRKAPSNKIQPTPPRTACHGRSQGMPGMLFMQCARTQCTILYVRNYLNPSFGPFTSLLFHNRFFLRFLCIEDVAHLKYHPFSPLSTIFTHFHPVLLHLLCYRWMLDYDDGESPDVLYIHNATNQQVGCYTLLSKFQPSWPSWPLWRSTHRVRTQCPCSASTCPQKQTTHETGHQ